MIRFTAETQRTLSLTFLCFPVRGRKAQRHAVKNENIKQAFFLAGLSPARKNFLTLRPQRLCGENVVTNMNNHLNLLFTEENFKRCVSQSNRVRILLNRIALPPAIDPPYSVLKKRG